MIPKMIHYCWFGKQNKPPLIITCIESWKVCLPDFEIKEWNEDNTILDCDFAQKAFEKKKWAFLSDYVRLKVLHDFGGVYLDTDMLFIKPLEFLLNYKFFIGRQINGQIAAGIIGAVKKNNFITRSLDIYRQMAFDENRLMNMAIPKVLTEIYDNMELEDDLQILDYEYFYPYIFEDSLKGIDYRESITNNTIAVHLWNASWFTEKEKAGFALDQKKYLKALIYLLTYYVKNPKYIFQFPALIYRYLRK